MYRLNNAVNWLVPVPEKLNEYTLTNNSSLFPVIFHDWFGVSVKPSIVTLLVPVLTKMTLLQFVSVWELLENIFVSVMYF
jgi:hypothetical protein